MVNLGIVRFEVLPLKNGKEAPVVSDMQEPVFPSLFTDFKHFNQVSPAVELWNRSNSPALFTVTAGLADLCAPVLDEFLNSGIEYGRRKAVIAPSGVLEDLVCSAVNALGFKAVKTTEKSSNRDNTAWKFVSANKGKASTVLVGPKGIAPLLAHLPNCDVLILDANAPAFEPDSSSIGVMPALVLGLKPGGAIFAHTYPGAGLRAAGILPPAIETKIEVFKIARWIPQEKSIANMLPNLILEAHKTSGRLLVVFNRLGKSGAFQCLDCGQRVDCPKCEGMLHFARGNYSCSSCRYKAGILSCPSCGSVSLLVTTEGADTLADAVGNMLDKKKVIYVDADYKIDESLRNAAIVISTDACLHRNLPYEPDTIAIAGVEDKLFRDQISGPEKAAAYIASICGMYGGEHTRTMVAAATKSQFFEWLSGDNKSYFQKRLSIAKKTNLPPFAPRFIIRIRSTSDTIAENVVNLLIKALPAFELGELRKLRSESSIQKVFEVASYTPLTYESRKLIVDIARAQKATALPYVVYY